MAKKNDTTKKKITLARTNDPSKVPYEDGRFIVDKAKKELLVDFGDAADDRIKLYENKGNVTYDVVTDNRRVFNETVNPPVAAAEGDVNFTILNGDKAGTVVEHIALGTDDGLVVRVHGVDAPLKYNTISNMLIQMTTAPTVAEVLAWMNSNSAQLIKGQLKDAETGAKITPEVEGAGATWGSITGNIQDQGDLNSRLVLLEDGKQDAEEGKGLSTNDFDDNYKNKLESVAESATKVEVSDTGTAEEEVNYITVTTANGHGTQKKIGGGANFTIGAGPLVIPQETTVNSASQQDWDPNYEYKYKFDIAVSGITATTRLTNMVAVLNTAYDNLAPNFDTVSGGLTFYTKEETLSEDITFSSYDIFTKNIKHDIDVNVTGNGSINAIPNKQVAGKQIALEINPDEGYALGAMTVKDAAGNDISVDEDNKFTMPDSNVTVTANFGDARTITLGKVEHGSIFSSVDHAAQGAIIKLDNTPNEGYMLDAWDVKDSDENPIEVVDNKFTMPGKNVTVTATFRQPPVKGDLIDMSLGNETPAAGTQDLYRVLKIDGNIAEVVAMYDMSKSQKWHADTSHTTTLGGLTVQDYSGCDLDIYLNSTFYNTLSDTAKAAIVDKAVKQRVWYVQSATGTSGNPIYKGTYGTSVPGTSTYALGLHSNSGAAYENDCGNRHIYALDVQDIIDYLEVTPEMTTEKSTLNNVNVWKMLWNTETQPSTVTYPWLSSADASYSDIAFIVNGGIAGVNYDYVSRGFASRLAFKIDLSKITWRKV